MLVRIKGNIFLATAVSFNRCPRASDGHYNNNLVDIGMSCHCDCLINSQPQPWTLVKRKQYCISIQAFQFHTHTNTLCLYVLTTQILSTVTTRRFFIHVYLEYVLVGVRNRTCVTINNSSLFIMTPMTVGKCRAEVKGARAMDMYSMSAHLYCLESSCVNEDWEAAWVTYI